MFANNARLWFKLIYQVEPEVTTFLGMFPEDDPRLYIYEFEVKNEDCPEDAVHSYIVIEEQETQLITREVIDSAEISAIMQATSIDDEERDPDKDP